MKLASNVEIALILVVLVGVWAFFMELTSHV